MDRSSERGSAPSRRGLPWLAALPLLVALPGCSDILGSEDVIWMEVAEARIPCTGVGVMECLLVRERPGDDWRLFYDWISGFEYEPGYRYTLTVGRKTVRNPPADGSSLEYRLKSVQGKVASPRFELLERAREAEELWRREAPVDYVMVQERGCFCLPDARGPVRLVVTRPGGAEAVFEQVISRHYVEDERPVPFEFSRNFLSVWELFGYLRHAVAREAHVIDVEFDEAFGYPRRVFVDSEAGMADDELEYLVHSLEAA